MTKKQHVKTKPKFATHSAPSKDHWVQTIEPRRAALLSETVGPCYFVIKNHGPGGIMLVAAYGDQMDLPAGQVRATYAQGTIRVENHGDEAVLVEFDFLASKK
jgi:hypothetical protein